MSNPDKIGIEYTIFEYKGQTRKQLMNFRAAPGNLVTAMDTMRKKLGLPKDDAELKEHVQKHVKNIIEGKVMRR